ncbi:MAG: universal stress protein [Nocardioidaceae bacterium]
MREFVHPIVVGYDGSADSERAVDWAVMASQLRNCPIRLVAVIEGDTDPDWLPDRVEKARQRALEGLRPAADIELPATVMKPRSEPTTHALLRLASDAQLIVLGAHGHGVVDGALIGSVSQHLARHAECPVVVAREAHDPSARRIVAGFDGSPESQPAVAFGFEMARDTKAPLTVIHGWRYNWDGTVGLYMPLGPDIPEHVESERAALRDAMTEWCEKYPEVHVELSAVPVHPIRVLTDASDHAAMVVVGSRGRGAFTGLLLGSVSQGVLHRARCTVVVAR